ncbi:lipoyl amidotransferase LIPT1, mitochondrial-like isoform X1 [Haliotis asinina]|uniref:lipoyl amidotransferase LIPT1, mitochondrial-like isoform X1 n=1 Tax=Haliotis asinina TaxID=109174 RepID=UPI003531EF6A
MLIHKLFCCPQNSRQFLRSVLKRWTWANTHALPHIANYPKQYTTAAPEHVVYVSRSKNIFENLALEDWIYQNGDLENRSYLLMWSNGPAVVLGLHQNPWMECNVDRILAENVDLARRKSGGGTVYHDEGNLNLSFIKSRPRYNRKENLELVKRALAHKWDVDLSINCREDLILDGFFKVSGTAAKLGGHRTYHHFTLLVDVDVERLTTLLQSPMVGVKSKSTESVPANVRNLVESAPSMDIPSIVQCIGDQFLHHNIPQGNCSIQDISAITDADFPGVSTKIKELKKWDFIFAKTPPFCIIKSYTSVIDGGKVDLDLSIDIVKGKIHKISVNLTSEEGREVVDQNHFEQYLVELTDKRLNKHELSPLFQTLITKASSETETVVSLSHVLWTLECIRKSLVC